MADREGTPAEFAAMMRGQNPPTKQETNPPEPDAEAVEAVAHLFAPKQADVQWLRALEYIEDEAPPPAEPQGPPSFDGGAREPFVEDNPEQAHNEFLVKLFERTPRRTGGGEW